MVGWWEAAPRFPTACLAEDGPAVGGCSTAVPLSSEDAGVRVVRAQSGEACSKAVSPWVGVPAERYPNPGRAWQAPHKDGKGGCTAPTGSAPQGWSGTCGGCPASLGVCGV